MDERTPPTDDGAKLFGAGPHAGGTYPQTSHTGPHAGPAVGAVPSAEPQVNLPESAQPQTRCVRVFLVVGEPVATCNFWIGLTKAGSGSPSRLLDIPSTTGLLLEAAASGMVEHGPLMLSDTGRSPARHIYLLPQPGTTFREQAIWVQDLVKTLRSWSPTAVGIYFAPELVAGAVVHELLQDVLRQAIEATHTNEFHLFTGTYGLNAVLNAALRTKSELDAPQLSLQIFH